MSEKLNHMAAFTVNNLAVLMYEAAAETSLGVIKAEDGKYYFVTQKDLEDYAVRCFRTAVDKLDVEKINNLNRQ